MIVEREEGRTSFKSHYFDRPNFSRMISVLRESFSFFGNYLKEDYQTFYKSTSLCHFFPFFPLHELISYCIFLALFYNLFYSDVGQERSTVCLTQMNTNIVIEQ